MIRHSIMTLILIAACAGGCVAQSRNHPEVCMVGKTAPAAGSWTWPAGSRVEVFVRARDFSAEELPSLLAAIRSWDGSSLENGSGVRFDYKGEVVDARNCDGCLTIKRGKTNDARHGAELHAFSKRMDQVIDYANIVIDPKYTDKETLTSIVAHELGHGVGLLDCFDCKRGSTAMGWFSFTHTFLNMKVAERSSGIRGPTACDMLQVRSAYADLKRFIRPAPSSVSAVVVDEGEEPEDDDTPIVVP